MCNVHVLSSQDNFHCKNPRCAKKLVGRHLDVSEQLTGNDRILARISSDKKGLPDSFSRGHGQRKKMQGHINPCILIYSHALE